MMRRLLSVTSIVLVASCSVPDAPAKKTARLQKSSAKEEVVSRKESVPADAIFSSTPTKQEQALWKEKNDSYWRKRQTRLQFKVCRKEGTERPFTGIYNNFKKDGIFHCSSCGQELFDSKTKFDSKTGWPSYYDVVDKEVVKLLPDYKLLVKRIEVRCNRCDAHLGHVFEDGPPPTGLRYCINSVCLGFQERSKRKK